MSKTFASSRAARWVGVAALTVAGAGLTASVALAGGGSKPEHWGVIDRNTIGSPVAELRDGPYSMTPNGISAPPFGKGSLGIETGTSSEKAAFGNEVDFFGDPALSITAVGFYVFQSGEDVSYGGAANMPNIDIEIDPNLAASAANFTTMVWNPPAPGVTNAWSGYLDATTTGTWRFTGDLAGQPGFVTGCNSGHGCTFQEAMTALDDGGDTPVILSIAVAKGRDSQFQGAVDGLRINDKIYDFEAQPEGVKVKGAPK